MANQYRSELDDLKTTDFDVEIMKKSVKLMPWLQGWCERERVQPMSTILNMKCEELEASPVEGIPTLSSMGLTFDEWINFLTSNLVYEVVTTESMETLADGYVSLSLTRKKGRGSDGESRGVIWLADVPSNYEGVSPDFKPRYHCEPFSLIGDVPAQLNLERSEIHDLVRCLYRLAGVSTINPADLLCEEELIVPAGLFTGTDDENRVKIKRFDFETARLSVNDRKAMVLSAEPTELTPRERHSTVPCKDIELTMGIVNMLGLAQIIRATKRAPAFLKNKTLGEIISYLNWLRVKQVIQSTMHSTCLLHNPVLDFPILRHFVGTAIQHNPQWRCHMYKFNTDGSIRTCQSNGSGKKRDSELKCANILLQGKQKRQTYASIHDLSSEERILLRLDLLLFLRREKAISYVESPSRRHGFVCESAHLDYPTSTASGTTSISARSRVAEMILKKLI